MNAANKSILLLWWLVVTSFTTASALTPGATETRVGQKSFAPLETRQAEPLQTPGLPQRNATCGYELAPESLLAAKGGTEVVQRAMSRAELAATESSGLLRGGRSGTHYVSDAVNSTAGRAQQRLALPQTPEFRVTLEVPSGQFSPPSRVPAKYDMPGGGMQRTGSGDVPVRILRVDEY